MIALTTTWEEFPALWGALLGEVWESVRSAGVRAGRNIMLYRDDRPAVEVGVEVHEPFVPRGRVVPSALPGGDAALAIAAGPPTAEGLAEAHDRVLRWSAAHGHRLRGDRWEIYSHWSEREAEMQTAVYWALSGRPA